MKEVVQHNTRMDGRRSTLMERPVPRSVFAGQATMVPHRGWAILVAQPYAESPPCRGYLLARQGGTTLD